MVARQVDGSDSLGHRCLHTGFRQDHMSVGGSLICGVPEICWRSSLRTSWPLHFGQVGRGGLVFMPPILGEGRANHKAVLALPLRLSYHAARWPPPCPTTRLQLLHFLQLSRHGRSTEATSMRN